MQSRNGTCLGPPQERDTEPTNQRMRHEGCGVARALCTQTAAPARPCGWEELFPGGSAKGFSGSGAQTTGVRSVPSQSPRGEAWSPHSEASSLQWTARGHRGRGRHVCSDLGDSREAGPAPGESESRLGSRFVFSYNCFPRRILSNSSGCRRESGFLCQQAASATHAALGPATLDTSLLQQVGKLRPSVGLGPPRIIQRRTFSLAQSRGLWGLRNSPPPHPVASGRVCWTLSTVRASGWCHGHHALPSTLQIIRV